MATQVAENGDARRAQAVAPCDPCATQAAETGGQRLAQALPDYALRVLEALESQGHEAWVVGGWVRDALLGAPSHDVDVTTSARWEESARCLRAAGMAVHETGTAHGTVTAVVGGRPVEVTTYRVERGYTDLRHPDEVRFVRDVREDLARRDFTVNAIAYHPARGLLDPYGGAPDLERGLIRAVGEPAERFGEDALRVLRAVRFACRLGFAVESRTQDALVAAAAGLDAVSRERVGAELDGIVRTGRVGWALRHQTDVMCAALPELSAMRGLDQRSPWHAWDVLEHTARVCNAAEAFSAGCASPWLRWAALLHDVAKPACLTVDETGRGHFYGHPEQGARMADALLARLALPHALRRRVCALVRMHDYVVEPTATSARRTMAKLERLCPGQSATLAHELLTLKRSDALGKARACFSYASELDAVERAFGEELARGPVRSERDLAVGGTDVMAALGVGPGPAVGRALRAALEAVVAGEIANDRAALMAFVRSLAG